MNEVIDLIDSDDDEEEEVPSRSRKALPKNQHTNNDNDEIELIGIKPSPPTLAAATTHSLFPTTLPIITTSSDGASLSDIIMSNSTTKTTPCRNQPPYSAAPTSSSRAVSIASSSSSSLRSTPRTVAQKTPRNPFIQTTPRVVSQSSQHSATYYDSDSSSDDSLMLRGGPIFAPSKKQSESTPASVSAVPRAAAKATSVTTNRKHSSSALLAGTHLSSATTYPSPSSSSSPSPPLPPTAVDDPPFQYPALLSTSKQYEDLRPRYILAFWKYARQHTQHSFDRRKLDQVANRIVILSLTPHPIRSLEEYCYSRGAVGFGGSSNNINDVESKIIAGDFQTTVLRNNTQPPPPGNGNEPKKYTSITEACLVAMLQETERRYCLEQERMQQQQQQRAMDHLRSVLHVMDDATLQRTLSEKSMWVSLEDLIPAIDGLLRRECPARLTRVHDDDHGAAFYTESTTRSVEFMQVRKLETCHKVLGDTDIARLKRHSQRGRLLYELTVVGYHSARDVRNRQFPLPPNYYRTSRIQRMSQVENAYSDICIGVDLREGGGGKRSLHEMCNILDSTKVPFFVASLMIGDYVFFTRGPNGNLDFLCPILVERKEIADLATSIHDGRWKSQKERMYIGQYVFGYENSRMVYIIEGKEERQQVTGGYVGHRMYGMNIECVRKEIENLKSEGFEVLRTPSRQSTMFELGRWTKKVANDMKAGVLTAQYTYAQFKEKVKKIPRGTDFSRLAKDAMKTRSESEAASARAASRRAHVDMESDSDIEVIEALSPAVDSKIPASVPKNPYQKPSSSSYKKGTTRASYEDVSSAKKKAKRNADADVYEDWTTKQLREQCVKVGLPKSGKKADLISRLNGPHPPSLWMERKRANEYVPDGHNVGGTALLIALYLYEKDADDDYVGMTKDELYVKAEESNITKNPFCGGTTQTGPYLYDGWSSMKYLLQGDPPLVVKKKGRFRLTRSGELAGYPVAEAMHRWCHAWGNCNCGAILP